MATKHLANILNDHLKYQGRLTTRDLDRIRSQLIKDVDLLAKLIGKGVSVVIAEETEEYESYYIISKNGVKITDTNSREKAIEAALKEIQ